MMIKNYKSYRIDYEEQANKAVFIIKKGNTELNRFELISFCETYIDNLVTGDIPDKNIFVHIISDSYKLTKWKVVNKSGNMLTLQIGLNQVNMPINFCLVDSENNKSIVKDMKEINDTILERREIINSYHEQLEYVTEELFE